MIHGSFSRRFVQAARQTPKTPRKESEAPIAHVLLFAVLAVLEHRRARVSESMRSRHCTSSNCAPAGACRYRCRCQVAPIARELGDCLSLPRAQKSTQDGCLYKTCSAFFHLCRCFGVGVAVAPRQHPALRIRHPTAYHPSSTAGTSSPLRACNISDTMVELACLVRTFRRFLCWRPCTRV